MIRVVDSYLFELLLVSLMDGAEDRQSLVCQTSKQSNDTSCALTVQSTCRFIQEKKKVGSSTQFHSNSNTLFLLDVQRTDHGILQFNQVQCVNHGFHICQLFRHWNFVTLSEQCRELECFFDGAAFVVDVHLLAISDLSVEGLVN